MGTLRSVFFALLVMAALPAHAADQEAQKPADDLDAIQQILETSLDDASAASASQAPSGLKTATIEDLGH